jgi:type IV pilus assembly protein PilV
MKHLKHLTMRQANPQAHPSACSHTNQQGATLIEVLVALLLLSFTLLGIAGLLSATTRYQVGTEGRSMSALMFNDLTNRMRTNLPQVPGYDAANATPVYGYSDSWSTQQAAITAPSTNCGPSATATCTSADRATYDLWEIRSMARRSMPQGSLLLSGNITTGVTATYMWFDKDSTNDAASGLNQNATCSSTTTGGLRQTCCPAAAGVGTTLGVRCLNFTFVP